MIKGIIIALCLAFCIFASPCDTIYQELKKQDSISQVNKIQDSINTDKHIRKIARAEAWDIVGMFICTVIVSAVVVIFTYPNTH
jgi:hypothetical protein